MKEVFDKLHFIKIKNFCSVKDNVKKEWKKREPRDLEKIFSKNKSDKGLLAKKKNKKTL